MLTAVHDYTHLVGAAWTTDDKTNELVRELMHNYKIKENDLQGNLRREKFTNLCWGRTSSRILKLAKVHTLPKA